MLFSELRHREIVATARSATVCAVFGAAIMTTSAIHASLAEMCGPAK